MTPSNFQKDNKMARAHDAEKQVKNRVVDIKQRLASQMEQEKTAINDRIEQASNRINDAGHDFNSTFRETRDEAMSEGRNYVRDIEDKTKNHPLAALAVAVGVGFFLGLVV